MSKSTLHEIIERKDKKLLRVTEAARNLLWISRICLHEYLDPNRKNDEYVIQHLQEIILKAERVLK